MFLKSNIDIHDSIAEVLLLWHILLQFDTSNQDIYKVDSFLAKVRIDMILPIWGITSFNLKA